MGNSFAAVAFVVVGVLARKLIKISHKTLEQINKDEGNAGATINVFVWVKAKCCAAVFVAIVVVEKNGEHKVRRRAKSFCKMMR